MLLPADANVRSAARTTLPVALAASLAPPRALPCWASPFNLVWPAVVGVPR